ncbi:MAG: DUF222 domain-containing protein [Proteobacteria bacterium]|nr:DUF222 domain-containing protein [Pseudomonadota bacterium]
MKPAINLVPIEDLDRAIVNLSARINAETYELIVLIRQFDERAGWLKWGLGNCAEWLHYRCDLSMNAAREKVRVAHALKTLPDIATAFATGTLSYSKVRAMTRVTNAGIEDALLSFALKTTTARVEERCRELRCGTADSVAEANRSHANRSLRMHRDPVRGTITITVELPLEAGELIDKALDRARESSIASGPEFAEESWAAQQADALVTMAKSYLSGHRESSTAASDNYQVTVHVDRTALSDGKGRSGLPIESVKRLCCDGETIVIVEGEHGEPLNVGRKTRTVPTAIKRALWSRDKGCVFPGCSHQRFVDAHHIQHWSAGGETSLDNLLLLCTRHHRLVHEGGFAIAKDYLDRWYFKRPDGQAVPQCGYRLEDTLDDEVDASGAALIGSPSAEGFLTRLDKTTDAEGMPALPLIVAERSPPAYLM